MASRSKSNDVETPITAIPGAPHWAYSDKHNQKPRGQGYDYHDPTSLQRQGANSSGYVTGNAITTYGKVGFRADQQQISTTHGEVRTIYLQRRYGATGSGSFDILLDNEFSTGVTGDFRTSSEHGFDVCQVDLDLTTLNPGVSAVSQGHWNVTFEHGETLKKIQAIIPYRTIVRKLNPVPLHDEYTYLVKERFAAFAGHTADATNNNKNRNFSYLPDNPFSTLTVDNLKAVWDCYGVKDPKYPHLHFNNRLQQYTAMYQVKTLPLPKSFVETGVHPPEKDQWSKQFNVFDRVLNYTVGRAAACIVYQRVYALKGYWADTSRWDIIRYLAYVHFPVNTSDRVQTRHSWSDWQDFGRGQHGYYSAGSDPSYVNDYDLFWSSNGEDAPTSQYESRAYADVSESTSDPFDVDYTNYSNAQGAVFKTLPLVEHKKLDSTSYNVLFNDHGTSVNDIPNTITHFTLSATIPEGKIKTWYGGVDSLGGHYGVVTPFPNHVSWNTQFKAYCARPGSMTVWGWGGREISGNTLTGSHSYCAKGNYYTRGGLTHAGNDLGNGKDNYGIFTELQTLYDPEAKETLYDVRSFITPEHEYVKNNKLCAYYKCCTDHTDKQIKLKLKKSSPMNPIELDDVIECTILIDKSIDYTVDRHSLYDNTVQKDHAMDRANTFAPWQSWGDVPSNPSVLDQLFIAEGAQPGSQVQFLSLSAGSLSGGSAPGDGGVIPDKPTGPKLVIRPNDNVVKDLAVKNTTKSWIKRFYNTGTGDVSIHMNTDRVPFESTYDEDYIEGLDTVTNTMTGEGDKLDDWSWKIIGANGTTNWRQDGSSNTFKLSAGEYVTVEFTSLNKSHAPGYNVQTTYIAKYPQPRGEEAGDVIFEITY